MADMQQAMKELQDTLTVVIAIQARQAELIKGHGEWLESHDRAMTEARERGKATDKRIEDLVSAIGKLITKDA